jgi:hypothetical protein
MRLRRCLLFGLAAVIGAAVAVLPAVAASETPTVEAITGCSTYYPSYPCWSPSSAVTIAGGGTVKFVDKSSSLEQGIRWIGTVPTCENVPSASQKGSWEGTCTFTQPGNYRFEGTQSYSSTGEVVVTVAATTTTTTSTASTTMAPTSSGLAGPAGAAPEPGSPAAGSNAGAQSSPLAGSAASAVRLAPVQHGGAVHGSVEVSQAGAGGRLEVQLLARRAALASAGRTAQAQVGRMVRATLAAGTVSFTVALDAKAARALHVHRRLALNVRIAVTPVDGSPVVITRSVLLRS